MTITCPHCQKLHRLPESALPLRKSAVRCKGCGRRFILEQGNEGLKVLRSNAAEAGNDKKPGEADEPGAPAELLIAIDEPTVPPDQAGFAAAENALTLAGEVCDEEEVTPTGKILRAFPQLRELAGERFSLEQIFTPTPGGSYHTRPNRLKARLLSATTPLLNGKILQPGEKVCKIGRGSAYFPFEIPYANGLMTLPTNYYALICTTHRLLLVNLDFRCTRPIRYAFQVLYDEIGKVSRGLFGTSLIIRIRNGGKWNFTTVRRALARELAAFIKEHINGAPSGHYDGIPRRQLCPACSTPLVGGLASCPACLTPFKTAREAFKRSLLLPGMGEIYLGNHFPGISMLLGYLLTWLIAVVLIIVDLAGGIWGAGLLLLAHHFLAGLMARRLGEKGYLAGLPSPPPPARPPAMEPTLTQDDL